MHGRSAIIGLVAVSMLAVSSSALAWNASKFSARIFLRGTRYFTSNGVITHEYPAKNDSPGIMDAHNEMQYDFDNKIGKGAFAEVKYATSKNLEIELGFGYTSMSLDILQRSRYWWHRVPGDTPSYGVYEHAADANPDFRMYSLRPGVNLILTAGSRIRPYLGARIDIMYIEARADLIIARPYVVQAGSNYTLFAGEDAEIQQYRIDDSQLLVGTGLESGLEFRLTNALSITTGITCDIHFKQAFSNFADMIQDEELRKEIEALGYEFEGIEFTNIGALIALRYYL